MLWQMLKTTMAQKEMQMAGSLALNFVRVARCTPMFGAVQPQLWQICMQLQFTLSEVGGNIVRRRIAGKTLFVIA